MSRAKESATTVTAVTIKFVFCPIFFFLFFATFFFLLHFIFVFSRLLPLLSFAICPFRFLSLNFIVSSKDVRYVRGWVIDLFRVRIESHVHMLPSH